MCVHNLSIEDFKNVSALVALIASNAFVLKGEFEFGSSNANDRGLFVKRKEWVFYKEERGEGGRRSLYTCHPGPRQNRSH